MQDVMERIQTTAANRIGGRPDAVASDLAYLTIGFVNVCLIRPARRSQWRLGVDRCRTPWIGLPD